VAQLLGVSGAKAHCSTGTERTKGREGYRKTEFGQDAAISVEEEAIFVQSYKSCACDLDLEPCLEHTLDARSPGIIVCKFGRNPDIGPREEAIFVPSQKCPYHVTFDLDLDLEQTLDARSRFVATIRCVCVLTISLPPDPGRSLRRSPAPTVSSDPY